MPACSLNIGFKKEISKEEFAERIENDTLLEVLKAVPVHKGDVFFIESGTMHTIGKNILIAEIQQNSNVTYRVYDYGRVGKYGKKRELHVDKALDVAKRTPSSNPSGCYPHIADCDYFTVDKLNLDGGILSKAEGEVSNKSFACIMFLDGEGSISCEGETVQFQKGDTVFLPAGSGSYMIEGKCDALVTTIREKAGLADIKINLGRENAQIVIEDSSKKQVTSKEISVNAENSAQEVLEQIAGTVSVLLEENNIPAGECAGIEIQIPGNADSKKGILINSEIFKWENICISDIIGNIIPLPVNLQGIL